MTSIDVILEEDKALLLLSSLPSSFEYLVTTLLYDKDKIDLEDVVAILSNKKTEKPSDLESHVESLVARGKTQEKDYVTRIYQNPNQKGIVV